MKILNEYPGSHHYWEEYEKSEYFCPSCGKQEVWQEQGSGDYYLGVDYICVSCGTKHHLDACGCSIDAPNDLAKVEQLRSGITKEPTTKRGG